MRCNQVTFNFVSRSPMQFGCGYLKAPRTCVKPYSYQVSVGSQVTDIVSYTDKKAECMGEKSLFFYCLIEKFCQIFTIAEAKKLIGLDDAGVESALEQMKILTDIVEDKKAMGWRL